MAESSRPRMQFMIGGVVDKANVGDVLEALFLANPQGLNISPVWNTPQPQGNVIPTLEPTKPNGRAPQLEAPRSKTAKDIALAELANVPSLSHGELNSILQPLGYSKSAASGVFQKGLKDGTFSRVGRDRYVLAKSESELRKPKKKGSKKARGKNIGVAQIILSAMEADRRPWERKEIVALRNKLNLQVTEGAFDMAIRKLIVTGQVFKSADGTFTMI